QRVVAVVIAKRSFRSSYVRRRVSDEGELCFCCESMTRAKRIAGHLEFLAGKQRRKHKLGHVFRQWRNRRKYQRRWSSQKNSDWKWLIQTFGFVIVKAATFLNLPMQAGRM